MSALALSPAYALRAPARNWKELSDEELIRAFREGVGPATREDLAEELLPRHQGKLIRWCGRFTRDRETALDLAQETLIRAYRNIDSYRGDCRFSTWLYVIARNQCMTALQKRSSEPTWVGKACAMDLADHSDLSADYEFAENRRQQWGLILETLDRTEARVMMMHYGEEMPLEAVSRRLGLTNKSGAKAYIVSARRKISAKMTALAEANVQ